MPGYLARQAELRAKGVSDVLVFCVNDAAVMKAWATEQRVQGSMLTFLADARGELTKSLGIGLELLLVLGSSRCKRVSMLVDDCVIKTVNTAASADDPAGDNNPEVTLVEKMLADL